MDECTLLRFPMIVTLSTINIEQWSVKLIWPVEGEFFLELQTFGEEWISTTIPRTIQPDPPEEKR
jgi:hypothetical protein